MNKKTLSLITIIFIFGILIPLSFYLKDSNIALLNPKGIIAQKEMFLLVFTILLGLTIVIPAVTLVFFTSKKYESKNKSEKYFPDSMTSLRKQVFWWLIPIITISILAVVMWTNTHELDPYKPIDSSVKPITIQVVALRWKWLFIYPEQKIATINLIEFPVNTPVKFELTADAPMNSFWIPNLSGQIYAMTGMSTSLYIRADELGEYPGFAAEISGEGFSGMKFIAKAVTEKSFNQWVGNIKKSDSKLDLNEYKRLLLPSKNNPLALYTLAEDNLYNKIIMKFMPPNQMDNNMEYMDKK